MYTPQRTRDTNKNETNASHPQGAPMIDNRHTERKDKQDAQNLNKLDATPPRNQHNHTQFIRAECPHHHGKPATETENRKHAIKRNENKLYTPTLASDAKLAPCAKTTLQNYQTQSR